MFWMCPSLEKYWMDVFQTLSLILNVDLGPNASFLARCIVLLRWRDAAPAHPHSVAEGHYVLSKSLKKKICYSVTHGQSSKRCWDLS